MEVETRKQKRMRKREEKLALKIKQQEDYVANVINYNRVAAIELANRAKERKPHKDAFISIQNVNKIYDNLFQAVYDFSLDIKKNEFIVFVGPSGCGKSTTLRMIAGLEEITAGNLFIGDTYANSLPPKDRDIAMVFQSYALYPHMSVYDNMAFALTLKSYDLPKFDEAGQPVMGIDEKKITSITKEIDELNKELVNIDKYGFSGKTNEIVRKPISDRIEALTTRLEEAKTSEIHLTESRKHNKEEIDAMVKEASGILQITECLDRKPKALSGGQRQRVALGRAIVKRAKLFLMDEPLSNLDAKLRVSMRSEIKRIHKSIGATTIYVTHDQTEAMTMADRIVIMDKGIIQQIGSPKDIYNHPENIFVATFIGSPAMNILEATIKDGKIDFGANGVLELPKEAIKTLVDKLNVKIEEIDNFKANGLEAEYEKEMMVKRETIALAIKNGKYKVAKGKEGVDPLDNISLDDEERNMCAELYNRELEKKLEMREQYQAQLDSGVYKVYLGVRPEDVYLTDSTIDKTAKVSNEMNADVIISELLGNEYFVHVDFAGSDLILKTGASSDVEESQKVKLVFDLNKIHLFDTIDKKVFF